MIIFRTEFAEYFNKKIHIFLEAELFYDDRGGALDFLLPCFFPKHLIREQEEKCKAVMEDLFDWTDDEYWHSLTAFHEVGLYGFLKFMSDIRHDTPEFDSTFYDKEDVSEVKALWEKLDIKAMFEGSIKSPSGLAKFLHNIETMISLCFEDVDFLLLPELSNSRIAGSRVIEELMGIDFDYYKEILPRDVQARHEERGAHSALFSEVRKMLDLISNRVSYHGLHRDFWHEDKPRSEPEIQILLDSLFAMFFRSDEHVDISRETDTGTGKIDFKFYRNPQEKVLIEVKLGSNPNLEKGLKKQLVHYMNAIEYDDAFYVVICGSKKDLARVKRMYEKNKGYDFGKNVGLYVLDVSEKVVASKL